MNQQPVTFTLKGSVAIIRLSPPREHNRVTPDMAPELRRVCETLNAERQARVVILTGCGQTFFYGGEADLFKQDSSTASLARKLDSHRFAASVASLKAPSIAAINGDALDQGLELALACDLRIVAEGANFGFPGLSKGVFPWDGGTQRLPRILGRGRAMEMFLTGRLVPAREAYSMGLVNKVVPLKDLQDAAQRLADIVAAGAPIAVQYTKEAVYKGLDMALSQGLHLEADLSFILQSTKDRRKGIQSFLNKEKPRFSGE